MAWFKSIVHSIYLLFLPLMIALISLRIAGEARDIYWVASLLVTLIAFSFFVVYRFGGWRHLPTVRIIITACLGAGALIVLGNWYSDKEEIVLPLVAAIGTLAGWLFWDQVYNRVPKTNRFDSIPEQWARANGWQIILVPTHKRDPSSSTQLAEWQKTPPPCPVTIVAPLKMEVEGWDTVADAGGLEKLGLLNKTAIPFLSSLSGFKLTGARPALFILNPNGGIAYQDFPSDLRKLHSPAFVSKILEALEKNEPVLSS